MVGNLQQLKILADGEKFIHYMIMVDLEFSRNLSNAILLGRIEGGRSDVEIVL